MNQTEFHPYLYQKELLAFCRDKGIVIEAYSPLTHGKRLNDPKIVAIAKKYSSAATKSTAQILIRRGLQHQLVVIPKSSSRRRISRMPGFSTSKFPPEDMQLLDSFNEIFDLGTEPVNHEPKVP